MSKKKTNTVTDVNESIETTSEVVETQVETTETPVTEETENPVTENTEQPSETVTENSDSEATTDDNVASSEEKVETESTSTPESVNTYSTTPVTTREVTGGDRYDTDLGDAGNTTTNPSDGDSSKDETATIEDDAEIADKAVMTANLQKAYSVKYAFSEASKRFAVKRTMTLLSMYDTFVKNRNIFIGLCSQDDYLAIEKFMNEYVVIYKYKTVTKGAKEQFLRKLRNSTDYVVMGK